MILFVVDQIAGAEYLIPLLNCPRFNLENKSIVLASAISSRALREHNIPCIELKENFNNAVKKILSENEINLGIISSSFRSELESTCLKLLSEIKIPTYQFIDTWANYSARFRGLGDHLMLPDGILAIDQIVRDGLISEGIPGDIIHIIGQPHLEKISAKGAPYCYKKDAPYLFVTQPIKKYFDDRLGYDEKIFIEECLSAWSILGLDWRLFHIAVHPEEELSSYLDITHRYSADIVLTQHKELVLSGFGAIVGMYSSILMQGALLGCPVHSYQPNVLGEDKCILSRVGIIEKSETIEDLILWLNFSSTSVCLESIAVYKKSIAGSLERLRFFISRQLILGKGKSNE